MSEVCCDYCRRPANLVGGDVIYPHRPDLASKRFWLCKPCGAWVGCHPKAEPRRGGLGDGTVPLGRLANSDLRRAKQRAHAAFDPMWKSRGMTRRNAYSWLAIQLGIREGDCHIGMFNIEQCEAVIRAVNERGMQ